MAGIFVLKGTRMGEGLHSWGTSMAYFVYLPGNFDVSVSMLVFCFPELPRPPVPANEIEQSCNMWTEFQRSGIFDEVVQRRTLSTFLETLTFVSAAGGFASRNYLDLQYPQMKLNNLATCGLSFSAVGS